jgi:hypothetical protein
MRSGVVAVLVGVVLALGSSASAKSQGVFPDLPGLGGAERLTHATTPAVPATTATSHHVTKTDRVPALQSSAVSKDPVAAGKSFIRTLPGTGQLPVFGTGTKPVAAGRESADGLAALALVVVVLFTRFLVRLNSFGRHA